jgi:Iap family predicted aminopeptidase
LENARTFQTQWGEGIAIESKNDEVITVAQKKGKIVVIRKDPDGMVRIKARPDSQVDLSLIQQRAVEKDPQATWYLHPSKKMLLNGSYKNPESKFSKLGVEELIQLFQ